MLLLALAAGASRAGQLRVQVDHRWGGAPLVIGRDHAPGLSVTRLDYLLSGFALRLPDGGWLAADPALCGYISAGSGRLAIDLGEVPSGRYTGLRFHIGPAPAENAGDPNRHPPDHPLHPLVCGLHWGWQGGYIFLALEGRWMQNPAAPERAGFAYHLATDRHRTAVELPLDFELGKRTTLDLGFDLAALFAGGAPALVPAAQASTHSRDGDPLAGRLAGALATGAFRGLGARPDFFQPAPPPTAGPAPPGAPVAPALPERFPAARFPPDNPLTAEGVALGARLFADPILSADNSISCASCHQRGRAFTDGERFSTGIGGARGDRNAMPLANLLWSDEFFWDGRAASLREQVLVPIQDPREMGSELGGVVVELIEAEGYPEAFEAAFGSRAVTPDRIGLALEQFLLTLVSADSRFDRAMRGEVELTVQERRGFELFVTEHDPALGLRGADCFHCHGGSLFTANGYFDNGLGHDPADPGRFRVTGEESDRGKFKAPSLRNIALTAPYMHDGRFATLEEVVEHYDAGVVRTPNLDPNIAKHPPEGLGLSDEDKAALVAFLETLSDTAFAGEEPRP